MQRQDKKHDIKNHYKFWEHKAVFSLQPTSGTLFARNGSVVFFGICRCLGLLG